MQEDGLSNKLSRRKMITLLAGSTYYAVQSSLPQAVSASCAAHVHESVKTAAGLKASPSTVFSRPQFETIEALAEMIIPADEHSPGVKAAGVAHFISEIVEVSPEATKELWIQGLTALDNMAKLSTGKGFLECGPEQQLELLTRISQGEQDPVSVEERFFVALKHSTVDGYYLSAVGIHQDLEYQGNTVLAEFPGCTHQVHEGERKEGQ